MSHSTIITASSIAVVSEISVLQGQSVTKGQTVLTLHIMGTDLPVVASHSGKVKHVWVKVDDEVDFEQELLEIENESHLATEAQVMSSTGKALNEFKERRATTLDDARGAQLAKRQAQGFRSARQNLAQLCDPQQFMEYGQFAVAAQRQRRDYQQLQSATAADGIITGVGEVNRPEGVSASTQAYKTALVINDYSVLAGTQGFFHHQKLDRILAVAQAQSLPVIMFTEGGGGRPGDTDITIVNSGLQCASFSSWAALSDVVPRIAVANGYCFAGNAALFGAADIRIATKKSWIGMAGPAMIEGGGLGKVNAKDIGPIETQASNGVVDIVADDEVHASELAKRCLGYFQGAIEYSPQDQVEKDAQQAALREVLPDDRRFVYEIRKAIAILGDEDSFTELKRQFGGAIITGFMRIHGKPVGVLASDCKVLGGAIDVEAGEKASEFMRLCNAFSIPLISLCDTPGFMVGPQHEQQGAVRRLSALFTSGAKLTVPLIAVAIRKCYGLGAQALLGGSTMKPDYMLSWPTGEFGGMGLEGAVKLGFSKELAAQEDPHARQQLFEKLVATQYANGQATEVASVLEIDAVIDPENTRKVIIQTLFS
ncbi:Methylmalonyl-CoA carboxyltransferase 12S subunit [Paraglaciecola mesophila]|uniref:Methylmalonyl-CoA carboxyltransferase 12S subunit n=1 Tax=Paraglaciecola mesophila TaxID=197222 RepID=A0A857JIS8_9ALTE|nr:carboxyl transferase domain-containing protein [Paraglaciecola mesophila]QHJ11202.1 Methylmalonyl-CoA carboxyltransferase 12S subunit [Paraglaciecola mesophila]